MVRAKEPNNRFEPSSFLKHLHTHHLTITPCPKQTMRYSVFILMILFYPILGVNIQLRHDSGIDVRNEIVFQDRNDCRQALSEDEAANVRLHATNTTNIITVAGNEIGRSGNRFIDVSTHLAMAFCCKSGLLELPATDSIFPSMDGSGFKAKKRFFDFSDAELPREFDGLWKRPDVCLPERIVEGDTGLKLPGVHDDLRICINRVYLRGCEAEYFGDVVRTDTCHAETVLPDENEGKLCRRPIKSDIKGTESLVVHVRSGDIFSGRSGGLKNFGQPPLQYYLDAIKSQVWKSVTIITFAKKDFQISPVFLELEDMNCRGDLGENVRLYRNRDWTVDLRSMLCADALVMSKSSTHCMTLAFTRARKLFVPTTCGSEKKYMRGFSTGKRYPGNTNVMNAEFPDADVYGIKWGEESEYSVYKKWGNTPEQYQEIVSFTDLTLEKCEI